MDLYLAALNHVPVFLLVLTRIGGLLFTAPVFSSRFIPAQWKAAFSLLLAMVLLPLVPAPAVPLPESLLPWTALAVRELLLGLTAGYVASLTLMSVQFAGQLLDMQIGFGMVSILDPQSGQPMPLIGTFYQVLAMLVFLTINGHHLFLEAVVDSFRLVPLQSFTLPAALQPFLVQLFSAAFATGLKLALPVLAAVVLADVAIGLLSRAVPQMNLFAVGLPAKLALGVFVLVLGLPVYVALVGRLFGGMMTDLTRLFRLLAQ